MLIRMPEGTMVLLMMAWLLGILLLLAALVAHDIRRSGGRLLDVRLDDLGFGAAVVLALVVPPVVLGTAWLVARS